MSPHESRQTRTARSDPISNAGAPDERGCIGSDRATTRAAERPWWEEAVIYQIYPRSFMDSNGDGIGDLAGIRSRLAYFTWLGIDAIWISPIYPSPMADFGYDVSDYTGIDPIFGTLADFDAMIADAHARGLKVLLDFVPNHTSVEHPWFRSARHSRESPQRDWYLWRDPAANGGPPNNWRSVFGGSAWEFDAASGQYYYHAYLREQPDLNWRNPAVRAAMLDVLRFWLDRGVDGFRIDVIWHLVKDAEFRDNPINPEYRPGQAAYRELRSTYTTDRPEIHEVIAEIRDLLNQYGERLLVGEIYLPPERLVTYYGAAGRGLDLPFNFQLIELPWRADIVGAAIEHYERLLPPHGWPNWVLGNHDKPRIASRVGDPQARIAAMLLLTLRGTPTLYYGDELGMRDVAVPADRVRDPWERNEPGRGLGRDPVRTPMQWTAAPGAGFSPAEPWLPLAPDYRAANVEHEREDPASMLSLYRRLLELRRTTPALRRGSYCPVLARDGVLAFRRELGDERLHVLLNLTSEPRPVPDAFEDSHADVLMSTLPAAPRRSVRAPLVLQADEGLILREPSRAIQG